MLLLGDLKDMNEDEVIAHLESSYDGFDRNGVAILVAYEEEEAYEGYAFQLFTRAGKLYENVSSHCSCYGHRWEPEETTLAGMLARNTIGSYSSDDQLIREFIEKLENA
jgi:hypothetical protein